MVLFVIYRFMDCMVIIIFADSLWKRYN